CRSRSPRGITGRSRPAHITRCPRVRPCRTPSTAAPARGRVRPESKGGTVVANRLTGLTVAFLIANEGTEKVELTQPWEAVTQEGGRPMLLAPRAGEAILFNHLDRADSWPVDQTVDQAQSGDFGALVLPGGVANADFLRMSAPAV